MAIPTVSPTYMSEIEVTKRGTCRCIEVPSGFPGMFKKDVIYKYNEYDYLNNKKE